MKTTKMAKTKTTAPKKKLSQPQQPLALCPRCRKPVPVYKETRHEDAFDVFGDDATEGQIIDAEMNIDGEWDVHVTIYSCPRDGMIEVVA